MTAPAEAVTAAAPPPTATAVTDEAQPSTAAAVAKTPATAVADEATAPAAPRPQAPPDDDAPGTPPPTPPAEKPAVAGHRRGPGIWLPLIVFVALLVAAAAVGRFVVPRNGPNAGAPPRAAATQPPATDEGQTPTPSLPALPTPPVRPADQLADWAGQIGAAINVPPVAVQAYGYAQQFMQANDPSCNLKWTTLAGIGAVETNHGQADGAVLQPGGRTAPVLMGPVQDGRGGRALVRDTDAGAFDSDATYDRALGPLHLMPAQWREFEIDADADGIYDPFDVDDSTLVLARLLCSGTDDMGQRGGWNKAVARQHLGDAYANSVFTAADGYGQRTRNIG